MLQHLEFDDLLACSLVSKLWSDVIGESIRVHKKIKLYIEGELLKNSKKYILASNRPYQNVYIDLTHNEYREDELSHLNQKTIIRKFASTIEDVSTNHDISRLVDLPKLKSFHIREGFSRSNRIFCTGFISKLKYVEYLRIDTIYNSKDKKLNAMLANAIKNMECLKVLKSNIAVIELLENFSDYKFRLEEFCQLDDAYTTMAHAFLYCHRESLTAIRLISYTESYFTDFPLLTSLHVDDVYLVYLKEYPVNRTITELKIGDPSVLYRPMLRSLVNLKTLKVSYLTKKALKVIFSIPTLNKVLYGYDSLSEPTPEMLNSSIKFEKLPRYHTFL